MAYLVNSLSQQDPAWKNVKLGFDDQLTLGSDGCAITCLAMLASGYGYPETPRTINQKLKDLGPGLGFMGPLVVWSGLTRICPQVKYRDLVICRDQDAPLAEIDAMLARGQAVVVEVDRSLAGGLQTHWVVLHARQGDDYLMTDPWPYPPDGQPVLLGTRYAFGRQPRQFITAVAWYDGQTASGSSGGGLQPGADSGRYVRVPPDLYSGLRLRAQPNLNAATLVVEPAETALLMLEAPEVAAPRIGVYGSWLNVRDPQGVEGWVAAWYVEKISPGTSTPPGSGAETPAAMPSPSLLSAAEFNQITLAAPAGRQISVGAAVSSTTRLVADIWNRYGGMLATVSARLGIDPGAAVATLAVESGGRGFSADGRMIIRFENHVFYNLWGRSNQAAFDKHFRFNAAQSWTGHQWRPDPNQAWRDFHNSQPGEWEAFSFARSLDETSAMQSISMGATQVMGFNFARIGYAGVQQMFTAFSADERYHLLGFFDYIVAANAVQALQDRDFVTFALRYNGSGQEQSYGGMIASAFAAFKQIEPGAASGQPGASTPGGTPGASTPGAQPQENVKLWLVVAPAAGPSGTWLLNKPKASAKQLGLLAVGARLAVVEGRNSALGKLGKSGKWINVRDPQGRVGYVSAAFVAQA